MKRLWAYLMVALLLNLATATAQERVWNDAIDRYEYVCLRCSQWRSDIEAGNKVPKDSLRAMMQELNSVRQNLLYALGEMTPGQRRRFEAIRDHFATGEWPESAPSPVCGGTVFSGFVQHPEKMTVSPACRAGIGSEKAQDDRIRPKVGAIAGAVFGVWPDFSGGMLGGMTVGKWAFFLKARSNFHWQQTSYLCNSDGTTEDGYFWSGDLRRINRHHLTLNASYAVWKPVSVYLGAGYGVRTLCWEDSDKNWARVQDCSHRGFALDAGLLVHPISKGPWKGLTLTLGISWISRDYLDAEAGIAWRFL